MNIENDTKAATEWLEDAKKCDAMEYHNERSDTYRLTAHYLFDLEYPRDTVAKIVGMSIEYVRAVERLELRHRITVQS